MHIDWWTLALQAVNFLVLVWLLQRFLYRPVLAIIARRQQLTESVIAEADTAKAAAEALRARARAAKRAGIARERDSALERGAAAAEADAPAPPGQSPRRGGAAARRGRASSSRRAHRGRPMRSRQQTIELAVTIARRLLADPARLARTRRFSIGWSPAADALAEPERRHRSGSWPTAPRRSRRPPRRSTPGHGEAFAQAARRRRWAAIRRSSSPSIRALIAGAELHFPHTILRHSWRDSLAEIEAELTHRWRT